MTDPVELVRRPLEVADATAWSQLDRRIVLADGRDDIASPAELAEDLGLPWARLADRSLGVFRPDDSLAGLAWIAERPGSPRARVALDVDPDERGRLDGELLAWAVEVGRREKAAGRLHADVLEVGAQPTQVERVRLLQAAGFRAARHWHELMRGLDDPIDDHPPPAGVSIRPWADDLSEQAHDAHVDAFRDHWGSSPTDAAMWRLMTVGAMSRPDLHRLAVAGGTVVGYLLVGVYPQDWELKGVRDGWVDTLGTRRGWRGRGVASSLLVEVMRAMRADGLTHVSLGVDSESPTGATRLYASLGFELARTDTSWHLELDGTR
jgi:mycothiol synthase